MAKVVSKYDQSLKIPTFEIISNSLKNTVKPQESEIVQMRTISHI